MPKRDPKRLDATQKTSRPDLDDFWDVENLLPGRPTRPAPPPRPTPTAVEVELSPISDSPREGNCTAPVGAVPLTARSETAVSPEAGKAPTAMANGATPTNAGSVSPAPVSSAGATPGTTPSEITPAFPPSASPSSRVNASPLTAGTHRGTQAPNQPLTDYEPDGALLHRVKVYGWQANYHYFDSFVEDAKRFHAMKPPAEARRETFFSYFPQYVQLNRRSTAWYLYWREGVRHGQYLDTDYAYVLLYLFELINLPVTSPSESREHRDLMAATWIAYRRPFPQLDHYMCEWLCDYCLIHELNAPVDILAPALDSIIMESRLKEFYLSAAIRIPEVPAGAGLDSGSVRHTPDSTENSHRTALATANILMRHCCQYDYRKSKFASGEHKALFDATIPAAVAHVLPLLFGVKGQAKPVIAMLDSTVIRDAYTGALCSYRNKRRIEVSYTSFSRSHELRFLIGDMVKHVENRLRGWIGVRSRLSVMSLPLPLRDALDAYLTPLAPPQAPVPIRKKEELRPAYESLYDLPRKEVSLADAAAIEADSWETTRILVEAFEGEENQEKQAESAPAVETVTVMETPAMPVVSVDPIPPAALVSDPARKASESIAPATESPLASYTPFIKAALDGDSAALRAAAKALGKMPDALADEINALTADGEIGDIILEDDGMGGYTVIEDYRELVREQVIELL